MDAKMKALYESYKDWVKSNPAVVSDVETILTWSSYFVAGRINKTPLISEMVYSASKLFTLFNDRLIQEAYGFRAYGSGTLQDNLKLFLTVTHYCEVFIELLVKRKFSTRTQWTSTTIIQVLKCASALVLLYRYKQAPVSHPPIPMLQRKKLAQQEDENSNFFVLKRSGRVIRRVEGAPPVSLRDWQPMQQEMRVSECSKDAKIAETIHVLKPLIHLGAMAVFGTKGWKQWILSLGLDLWSLKIYSKCFKTLTYEQKLEISRRKLGLLLYLLRSPVFDKYSQRIIQRSLTSVSGKIPASTFICNPIMQYLEHWQDIYFYMWTS